MNARSNPRAIAVVVVAVFLLVPAICPAVSFDCTKAQTFREKAVCSNSELGGLDDALNSAYREATRTWANRQGLVDSQRKWISDTKRCVDDACIATAYRERIDELDGSGAEDGDNDNVDDRQQEPNVPENIPAAQELRQQATTERQQPATPASEPRTSAGLSVQTVIADGIGKDPQDAAQAAARNALTNVVGSFLDSDTIIKKQEEIAEGIRTQTKEITRQNREYSQGTIQSIELLKTEPLGELFKVTAKVSVRIDDFKAYIKKLAEGETEVGAGLFAQMATQKGQKQNLAEIIGDIINPIVQGQVVEFKISAPRPTDQNNVVEFDVTAALNKDFIANAEKKLSATALKKVRIGSFDGRDMEEFDTARVLRSENPRASLAMRQETRKAYDGYVFALPCEEMEKIVPGFRSCGYGSSGINFPGLEINILGSGGTVIQSESIDSKDGWERGRQNESATIVTPSSDSDVFAIVPYIPMACGGGGGVDVLVIERDASFKMRMHVEDAVLKQAQKIVLKLVQ